jgi:acyl dehydratase
MSAENATTSSAEAADGARRTVLERLSDLNALVGTRVGTSPWLTVEQEAVDAFGRITRDEQWIHVDVERAASGPFGTTIAHGYFVLSHCSYFAGYALEVKSTRMAINYGLNRVRFPSPVPVGAKIRGHVDLTSVTEIDGGVQIEKTVTVEVHGNDAKPACVATLVARLHD